MVAVTALVCTASAPSTPTLTRLFTVPVHVHATTAFRDGRLYVAETTRRQTVELHAYRLPDGDPQWSVTLPGTDGAWIVTTVPGVIVVNTQDLVSGGAPQVSAVDARTGRLLWRRDAHALTVASAGRVLVLDDLAANHELTMTSVDARTGAGVWSTTFPNGSRWALRTPTDDGRLGILTPDGALSVVSTRTGARLATLATRVEPAAMAEAQVLEVRGRLLVGYRGPIGTTVLASYDPATLSRNWQVVFPAGHAPYLSAASDCDPYLCVLDDGAMTALDPATGASVWAARGWNWAEAYHGWVLAGAAAPSKNHWGLLDPRTGTQVLDLTGWDVSGDDILTRPGDPAWVARLDPTAPRLRPLAPLPGGWSPGCTGEGTYLACVVGPVLNVFRDNSIR